jgi:long-chain acyl-CoA synthetase
MRPYVWNPWLTARRAPDRPAVLAGDAVTTFADLTRSADRVGVGLRALGVAPGAVVSTTIPTGPDLFALALACLRYGFGLFPVSSAALGRAGGSGLIGAAGSVRHVGPHHASVSAVTTPLDEVMAAGLDPAGLAAAARDGEPAGFLVFNTSGTTGRPTVAAPARPRQPYRGVAVVERYGAGPDHGPHVMTNPAFHLGTLGPALYALQAGSGVVVLPDRWSAAGFAEAVDRHRADSAFLSPDRLADLVATGHRPRHRLVVAFHGGAPCPPPLKRAAMALLGPVLHEYYGTSEGVVSEIGAAEWLARPGSVGRPLPGLSVRIEAGGRVLPAGEPGEIVVTGRGRGRVCTGDLGRLDPDGYLYVLGRIATDGSTRPAEVEHAVRQLPGVVEAVVRSTPDGWLCQVEASPGYSPDLRARIEALVPLSPVEVRITRPGSLPRTASGKVTR